jgi:FAD/FMN-containing dehydrogenase
MNRRTFIKALAGIPFLGLLKPAAVEASAADLLEQTEQVVKATVEQVEGKTVVGSYPLTVGPDGAIYVGGAFAPDGYGKLAVWNGSTWKEISETLDGRNGQYVEIGKAS